MHHDREALDLATADWIPEQGDEHVVQLYERDEHLVAGVAAYAARALVAREAVLIIATPEHARAIAADLADRGLDVDASRRDGRYVEHDAAATLDRFMVAGAPDPGRFARELGAILGPLRRAHGRVHAFGEMVALLALDGAPQAARDLEDLWNDLARTERFTLYCAYPMKAFDDAGETFDVAAMCARHTHVLPAESWPTAGDEDARRREIARLQQRSRRLALETARRRDAEDALFVGRDHRDAFIAMLAHELRNPLAPIRNGIEILAGSGNLQGTEARVLGIMDAQTRRLTKVLDDLLDVSRFRLGRVRIVKRPARIDEILEAVVEDHREALEAVGHELTVEVKDAADTVEVDAQRIRQALGIVLENAVKFTPPRGRIRIVATAGAEPLTVEIHDSGIGIPDGDLAAIFELFSQVDDPSRPCHGGLGVGLNLARSIVELHGGTIAARSPGPGEGSVFTIRLPAR